MATIEGSPVEFEFLAENATDVLSRHAPDGTFLYVSAACRRLFGHEPEDLLGRNVYDFFHPDEGSRHRTRHQQTLEVSETVESRYRVRCADGSFVPVETAIRTIKDDAGEVVEIHAVTRDISGRLESEELRRQWELCFKQTKRGIAIVDPDSGVMRSVNPSLAEMHGAEVEDLVGRPLQELFTAEEAKQIPERAREAHERGYVSYVSDHVRTDGSTFPVRTEVMTARDDDEEVLYRIGWFEDLSEQRRTGRERDELQRDFENAFEFAPNGFAIVDLEGRFERVNPKLCELTGYSATELQSLTFQEITHPEDLDADLDHVEELLAGEISSYQMEKRYYTKGGHLIWIQLSVSLVRDEDGAARHFLSQIQDISSRKRMEETLKELADKDSVTGLANRRRFEEELGKQASRCSRYGEQAALILLDLDRFKQVNDSRGHKAGDLVIRAVGRGLTDRVRGSDTVARLGGDEFAVLLLNVGAEEAIAVAEQIRERVATDSEHRGDGVTASVGVVHFDGGSVSAEDMLVAADTAMYEAKRAGRNRVAAAGS